MLTPLQKTRTSWVMPRSGGHGGDPQQAALRHLTAGKGITSWRSQVSGLLQDAV